MSGFGLSIGPALGLSPKAWEIAVSTEHPNKEIPWPRAGSAILLRDRDIGATGWRPPQIAWPDRAEPLEQRSGPYGGTGRRVRLKIGFRKECWFDSG